MIAKSLCYVFSGKKIVYCLFFWVSKYSPLIPSVTYFFLAVDHQWWGHRTRRVLSECLQESSLTPKNVRTSLQEVKESRTFTLFLWLIQYYFGSWSRMMCWEEQSVHVNSVLESRQEEAVQFLVCILPSVSFPVYCLHPSLLFYFGRDSERKVKESKREEGMLPALFFSLEKNIHPTSLAGCLLFLSHCMLVYLFFSTQVL